MYMNSSIKSGNYHHVHYSTCLDSIMAESQPVPENPTTGVQDILNNLHFCLNITTTKTMPQQGNLLNRFEAPDSRILDITADQPAFIDEDLQEFVQLTSDQLKLPAFIGSEATFYNCHVNDSNIKIAETWHTFTNQRGHFTVEEMVENILVFEKLDRPKSCWFGGVDAHHIFYEGVHCNSDGKTYSVHWGS